MVSEGGDGGDRDDLCAGYIPATVSRPRRTSPLRASRARPCLWGFGWNTECGGRSKQIPNRAQIPKTEEVVMGGGRHIWQRSRGSGQGIWECIQSGSFIVFVGRFQEMRCCFCQWRGGDSPRFTIQAWVGTRVTPTTGFNVYANRAECLPLGDSIVESWMEVNLIIRVQRLHQQSRVLARGGRFCPSATLWNSASGWK